MNPWRKAHRQARRIAGSKRKRQSVRAWAKHMREALAGGDSSGEAGPKKAHEKAEVDGVPAE